MGSENFFDCNSSSLLVAGIGYVPDSYSGIAPCVKRAADYPLKFLKIGAHWPAAARRRFDGHPKWLI